jgi:DNA polymerase-3 subunit delta
MASSVHLVRGDDPVLVSRALQTVVDDLVGDADRSLVVEELHESNYANDSGFTTSPLIDAAGTPPFLTEFRVVVARELAVFTKADQVAGLVAYLADPLPSTHLVLVWERGPSALRLGAVPKSLVEAVKAAGGVEVKTSVGSGRAASDWLNEQLSGADVVLGGDARRLVAAELGEERSRVGALLDTLVSAFGVGADLTADDVAPFIGGSGGVPPWDLTDAIAAGEVAKSVMLVRRMTASGERHPLQITASLNSHYERLLRLDGARVADEKAAAAHLGMKGSTFPAKKALEQGRRMGGARVARAVELLAVADLDLRGATAQPAEGVLEILVARLAHLSRR